MHLLKNRETLVEIPPYARKYALRLAVGRMQCRCFLTWRAHVTLKIANLALGLLPGGPGMFQLYLTYGQSARRWP